jgi:hypothetical protein
MTDKEVTEDRRSPDQDTAMEKAFVAAKLPEEDRRAPVVVEEPVVPGPNDELSVVRERGDGVKLTAGGHILE